MGKSVFILSGSPRKGGNSDTLCDQFSKGAIQAGHRVERVFLGDKTINYCTGCYICQANGGKCAHDDDMKQLLESMIAADVIVLATPVYFYTMCAQMKTVIDRTVARYAEIAGKDFYFIVAPLVGSRAALKRTIEGFRGFLECLPDATEKGIVYGTSAWNMGDILSSPAMAEAREMGASV